MIPIYSMHWYLQLFKYMNAYRNFPNPLWTSCLPKVCCVSAANVFLDLYSASYVCDFVLRVYAAAMRDLFCGFAVLLVFLFGFLNNAHATEILPGLAQTSQCTGFIIASSNRSIGSVLLAPSRSAWKEYGATSRPYTPEMNAGIEAKKWSSV